MSMMFKNSRVSCSIRSMLTVVSRYQNHGLPSLETGIWNWDHLHARCTQTQATTVGGCLTHIVVRVRE